LIRPLWDSLWDSFSGYFLEINEQYSKLLEYSAQELQKTFQSVTHPTTAEDLSKKLKEGTIRVIQWKNDI
jgi:hypothetical protein